MSAADDGLRDQLAEALRSDVLNVTAPRWAERVADELLPTVRAYGEQRAAEELRRAARAIDRGAALPLTVLPARKALTVAAANLRDRADELDGQP